MAKSVSVKDGEMDLGRFTFIRFDKRVSYVCPICKAIGKTKKGYSKTSKIRIEWIVPSGGVKYICNGCFGTICMQNKTHNLHGKFIDAVKGILKSPEAPLPEN